MIIYQLLQEMFFSSQSLEIFQNLLKQLVCRTPQKECFYCYLSQQLFTTTFILLIMLSCIEKLSNVSFKCTSCVFQFCWSSIAIWNVFVEFVKFYLKCVCACKMGVLKISLQVHFLINFFIYDIEENLFQVCWILHSVVRFCRPPLDHKCNDKIHRCSNSPNLDPVDTQP